MIFDGRAFAKEIEEEVKIRVSQLSKKPVIMSILVGNDPASELYTSLKKKAAERVGIKFEIHRIDSRFTIDDLRMEIREIGDKENVDGIMIQLPLPGSSRKETEEIIKWIPLNKDVDGLRWEESNIMPATVKAVILILEKISKQINDIWKKKFLIVGGTGSVGRPLVHYLKNNYGVEAEIANSKTNNLSEMVNKSQIVISCVGRAGLITNDIVDDTKIVIDVGISPASPQFSNHNFQFSKKVVGDMEQGVYEKARVAVPVPGGVGPVTVASLMANALEMCTNHK